MYFSPHVIVSNSFVLLHFSLDIKLGVDYSNMLCFFCILFSNIFLDLSLCHSHDEVPAIFLVRFLNFFSEILLGKIQGYNYEEQRYFKLFTYLLSLYVVNTQYKFV